MKGRLPAPAAYRTKDGSSIRELAHPQNLPGLGMSLAEAVVEAGEETIPHLHTAFDELYYCLEGEGVLVVDGESFPFLPGECYLMPRGAVHFLQAATRLRLLCACSPAYTHEQTIMTARP